MSEKRSVILGDGLQIYVDNNKIIIEAEHCLHTTDGIIREIRFHELSKGQENELYDWLGRIIDSHN